MSGPEARAVVAVGAIVIDEAGRVLLVQRGRPPGVGLWTVPGGRVEYGETLAAAVAREVEEETGIAVVAGPLVEVVERITAVDGGAYHYVILDYLATGAGEPRASDDAQDARWVAPEELASMALTEGLVPVIVRARAIRDSIIANDERAR